MHHDTSGIQQQGRSVEIEGQETSRAIQPCEGKKKAGRKPPIEPGQVIGRLTAIRFLEKRFRSHQLWEFKCSCGSVVNLLANNVKRNTSSCGCIRNEVVSARNKIRSTHRMVKTSEYGAWAAMKSRCINPEHANYPSYGGRGITICDSWKTSFESFYADMGPKPKGMSIDRIDNNKGYCKENCRWATASEQQNNRRVNHWMTFQGQTKTISQWASYLGVNLKTLITRVCTLKWSDEKALSTPIKTYDNQKRSRISSI